MTFVSAEQHLMYGKARLFGDSALAKQSLQSE
jgi:hypothetical protein